MQRIHLYNIYDPATCELLTGKFLDPNQLVSGDYHIPKEDFAKTSEHLKDYHGKWHIEVLRKCRKDPSPFDLEISFVGPNGYWIRAAEVYLILEEREGGDNT